MKKILMIFAILMFAAPAFGQLTEFEELRQKQAEMQREIDQIKIDMTIRQIADYNKYMESQRKTKTDRWINLCVAGGTIILAIAAVFGPLFWSWISRPKLRIEPHNLEGIPIPYGPGITNIFYHLKVRNLRRRVTVRNCAVLLKAIYRKNQAGAFEQIPMYVPLVYAWAPSQLTEMMETFTREHVFDFGELEGSIPSRFVPTLRGYTSDFGGYITGPAVFKYCLEVTAENYSSKQDQVFEVDWNGKAGLGNVTITPR